LWARLFKARRDQVNRVIGAVAGFALFDAGLRPTLLKWLTVGSSLDPSGELGARLWEHHFGSVLSSSDQVGLG
jgi:hypothetical protein